MYYTYIKNIIIINSVYEVYTPILKKCLFYEESVHTTDNAETKKERMPLSYESIFPQNGTCEIAEEKKGSALTFEEGV